MKRIPTIFLQIVIILIGIGVLVFMLWEPHLEGRNVGATLFETYFKDPFLAYVYISSISFFMALYQAFKVLSYIRQDKAFSHTTIRALRAMRYCILTTAGSIVLAGIYLSMITRAGEDDIAGPAMLGMITISIFVIVAATAKVVEDILGGSNRS